MAWRTADGFCVANADTGGGSGRSLGRKPHPRGTRFAVATVGTAGRRSGGWGFFGGLVTAAVARVQIELRNGTTRSAATEPAPAALDADLRTFLILTPSDGVPVGPSYAPVVPVCTLLAADGRVLERLTNSRRPRP